MTAWSAGASRTTGARPARWRITSTRRCGSWCWASTPPTSSAPGPASIRCSSAAMASVRKAFGETLTILGDANPGSTVAAARRAMPGLEANGVGWLEEPFPAHDHRSYATAVTFARVPLAAGENHYTRFEFTRVVED